MDAIARQPEASGKNSYAYQLLLLKVLVSLLCLRNKT
jgi:hypothetical protein